MRVALLNPCYWPEVRRGSERLVHDLAVGLHERGVAARILTSHPGPPSRRVEEGVPVTRHWRPPERLLARRFVQPYVTHLPFAALDLAASGDDVAHAFYLTDAVAAARWGRRAGRPSVFTWAGLANRRGLASRWHTPRFVYDATREATCVVTLSAAARDALWRWTRTPSRIIAPGVNLDAFTPGGERAERPTLFCPAALTDSRKRGDLLLAAFALLRRTHPDAELVLSRPRDPAAADRLAAHPGVVLAGVDGHDALLREYRRSWLTVLCSRDEAFGLVVTESLACGTPAVVSSDGGSAEIVDTDAVGRRFDGDEPEAVRDAIAAALELHGDAGTAPACRRRAEDFGQDRCTVAHQELYAELLAR
jgi:glycosyltransferase involved in cell wall biosynthesis